MTIAELSDLTDAHDWNDRLDHALSRLAAFRQPAEDIFLSIGRDLRDSQTTARDLTIMAEALNQRLEAPDFREALDGLDDAVAEVQALCARKDDRANALRGMAEATKTMDDALGTLARTLTAIRALGLNARIEAVRMASARDDFTVFTHQIMRLASDGQVQVEQARTALCDLASIVRQAEERQSTFAATHMSQLATVADHLGHSVGLMRDREARAGTVLRELPGRLEQVRERIASLVGNLQIGDITRQRLEHVEEALGTVRAVLEAKGETGDGAVLSVEQMQVLGNAVCDLQSQQLIAIDGDISSHLTHILTDVRALKDTLGTIETTTEAVYSEDAEGGSTFLMEVDRDLARVVEMITLFTEAQSETEAVMDSVGTSARAMRSTMAAVREIDAEINIIGLNASIKCGNLGDRGRALNTIAQELRALAHQTRALAQTVADTLTDLAEEAGRVAQRSSETARGETVPDDRASEDAHPDATASDAAVSGQDVEHLRQTLDHTVDLLHHAGGETAWVLARIREKGAEVTTTLEHTATTLLNQQRSSAETLAEEARALDRLAGDMAPPLPEADLRAARRDVLSFLEAHYTMASERDLHAMLLGETPLSGPGTPAPASQAPATDGDDLSDILF